MVLRNRGMTLRVNSSVTYIVCVQDSEGHRMGLESQLIVELVFLSYMNKERRYAPQLSL